MTASRHMVRMAEQVVSANRGDVLVSLGLGSCIGLALVDENVGVAGLVHIVLPEAPGDVRRAAPAKFADTAVPALIDAVTQAGGRAGRLKAVLCGGAHMFGSTGPSPAMQIGARNAVATMEALQLARIAVRGKDTGGSSGRSIEVHVANGDVLVRGVGLKPRKL
jgi:chemotaxis protein CheD